MALMQTRKLEKRKYKEVSNNLQWTVIELPLDKEDSDHISKLWFLFSY